MNFQKLVLGDQLIETETQKRKILLGAYLICMYLGIDAFFFLVSFFNYQGTPFSLFIGVAISLLCLILIRRRWVDSAIVIHLIRSNFFAFYFSRIDDDPYQTGTFIFFIPACLGALAVFGYQERWKGIGFALISAALFLIAILDPSKFSPQQAHFYFIINFLIVLIIGLLILLFFDRMVIESEKKVLSKNNELVKASSELDRFVYSVSHDLRAPLSSILGLVQVYKFSGGNHEKEEIVNHIQMRALKLDEFIKEILDYARNTRTEVRRNTVDLHHVILEVTENVRYISGFERIKMIDEIPESSMIRTDPERLKIVLNNLFSNAIKYQDATKPDSFVRISMKKQDNWCLIAIEDNGIGIRSEYQPKMFGMFYRANDSVEGSGLGLYIVKEAIERMQGRIEMTSEYAKGTTFRIFLPLETSQD